MEPVMLIEVLDEHGAVSQRQRIAAVGGTSRIGRSLHCDLPIEDAFAAPEHTLLTLLPDGTVLVQDLGTRNGTRVGGQKVNAVHGRAIRSGELRIGRTRVRVRTAEPEMTPERLFRRGLLRRYQTRLAIAGVVLCVAFAAFMAWTRYPGNVAQNMVVAVLVAVGALGIWACTWSLVARLSIGSWLLRVHLALAAACLALWGWGFWLYTVGAFAFQWQWLGPFAAGLAAIVAYVAAWRHLRYATALRRVTALSLALLAPLLCGGVWWLVDLQLDPRSVNRVQQGARILPPSVRVAPSMALSDYLTDAQELQRDASRNRQQSLLESPILDEED